MQTNQLPVMLNPTEEAALRRWCRSKRRSLPDMLRYAYSVEARPVAPMEAHRLQRRQAL